ncbi:MAG TPA: preprotein translocase subunit SecY [Candidatus Saccharimonadales bacterium]|nr:preprotein translocase subunit SecY [Candidatus Saccharimonadales bacterium]
MNWHSIIRSFKSRDMQKRLVLLLLLIVVYRFLSHIPIPLASHTQLKTLLNSVINGNNGSGQLLGFINLLSGGALTSFSIMLVGLAPFINASIIIQLLTKAIPRLDELNKEGETGRQKLQQWTRIITFPLAVLQSIGFLFILRQSTLQSNLGIDITAHTTTLQWVLMIGAMTTGAMILMWLGELITEQGLGNGISLVIFAGIVSQLPNTASILASALFPKGSHLSVFGWFTMPVSAKGLGLAAGLTLLTLISIYCVVKLNEAQRIIRVSYAKRIQGNQTYSGVEGILPVKLITAGVIPVIFAVSFLALPSFVGQLLTTAKSHYLDHIGTTLVSWFQTPSDQSLATGGHQAYLYPLMYFLLVVIFTYFYTNIAFSSKDAAENLQKQNGFIANIRPGKQTEKYLSKTVNRLMLFGSLSLGLIAVLPFITEFILVRYFQIAANRQIALGGTGLLIVVAVTLETIRLIHSRALMVAYDEGY